MNNSHQKSLNIKIINVKIIKCYAHMWITLAWPNRFIKRGDLDSIKLA